MRPRTCVTPPNRCMISFLVPHFRLFIRASRPAYLLLLQLCIFFALLLSNLNNSLFQRIWSSAACRHSEFLSLFNKIAFRLVADMYFPAIHSWIKNYVQEQSHRNDYVLSSSAARSTIRDCHTNLSLHAFQAFIQLQLPALARIVVSESKLVTQFCKNFQIVGVEFDVLACQVLVNSFRMCTLRYNARASTHAPS